MFDETNRFRETGPSETSSGISLAPMIDVVFLLLIFFMVSTTFVIRPGLKLNLPESESKVEVPAQRWVISLTPEGALYLNNNKMAPEEVFKKLESNRKPVTVRAGKDTPHGRVVNVLDGVRSAGIQQVSLTTKAPESEDK